MMDKKYLNVDKLLDMLQCYDEYSRENQYDEIEYQMDVYDDISYYKVIDNEKYCDIKGAKKIIDSLGLDYDEYKDTIEYLNKDDNRDGIELKTDLKIRVTGGVDNKANDDGKSFIEDIVMGICTNGKSIDEIDTSILRKRDIVTINNAMKTYEDSVKAGHKSNPRNLCKVYDYVNDNDPDICRRMLYYYDTDPIDLGDYKDRYNFMEYDKIRKALNKCYKKKRKENKKNKNKQNK